MSTEDIAAIGLKLETDGIEKGVKALDVLASKGPAVEKSMAQVEASTAKTGKTLESLGRGSAAAGLSKVGDAASDAARDMGKIDGAAGKTSKSLEDVSASASIAAKAIGAIGIAGAVRQYLSAADAITTLNNSLKLSTGSTKAAADAYEGLYEIAQRSRVSFLELGNTYSSIARATGDLGVSQQRMLKVTESIANAMTISGGSAQGMNAALVQLGQGMASGTLRGEELNSILEQAPRLAKALADGLNVPIGKLREMGAAGEITSQQIVKALESQSAVLSKEVTGATITLGQAFTQLTNSGTKAVGEFDKASGASTTLAQAISSVAKSMDNLGTSFQNNAGTIQTVMGALAGATALTALAAIPRAIAAVTEAVSGLAAVLAANPVVLTLLGVGAAVGGGLAAVNAYSKTAEGIKSAVRSLEEANQRSEAAMQRALDGGRSAGADNIRKTIEERKKAIRDLNAELALMSNTSLDNRAEEARLAAGTEQYRAQQRAAEELAGIKQKLSGVDKDYLPTLNKLFRQYQDGNITLKEYQALVGKLAADNYKPEKKAEGVKEEQSAYASLVATIKAKIAENNAEINSSFKLSESDKLRIKLMEELNSGAKTLTASHKARALALLDVLSAQEKEEARIKSMVAAYKQEQETAEEIAAAYVAQSKAREDGRAAVSAYANGIDEATRALQLELSLMGQSEQTRAIALEQYRIELDLKKQIAAIDANTGFNEREREEERARARAAAAQAKANAGNKAIQDDFTRTSETIERSLTDALLRGFESGKGFAKNLRDTVANMFKTLVLRPIISAVVNPVAGAITGALGLSGTAKAGTSALSTVGSIGSGASMLGSLGSGFANGLSAWGSGGSVTGVLSNPGLYTGAELAGALAPIALGVGALMAIAKATKGETRTGGQFGVAFDGSVTNQRRGQTYTVQGQQFDRDFTGGASVALTNGQAYRLEGDPVAQESAIRNAVAGTAKTINTLLEKYGSEAAVSGFSAGLETSGKGRGGVFAGGLLSTGAAFGESGKGDNYAGTLYEKFSTNSPDFKTALENFTLDLQQATLQALQAATDLPAYVSRVIKDVDVESLGAEDVAKLLTTIGDLPGALLQGFGATRDALAQQFAQGLALGDATAAGQSVADTLVASIETSLYNDAAGKIFDIVNSGIVAPMLDAIATGASVSEALSQATIDKTIERAKAQASALSELFGNAEFVSALEQIRTTVGAALGQAGDAFGYTPKFQLQAAQQIDTAAQSASSAADEAARAWQQITDGLLTDRNTAEIALLRAQGREEEALARERAKAIEGFDAYQIGLYDGTQAILSQVTALEKQAEATKLAQERAAELASTLASELPGVLDKFLSPDQRLAAGYTGIASDLSKVGINVDAGALAMASMDQIAAAAMAVYNLGTTSDEARLALVRAASGLADLKAEATSMAASRTDAAFAALERSVQARRDVLQGTIADMRAVFDAATSGVKALRGQVESVVQMSGKQGQAFIANALSNARATGYLPDGKDLQDAISATTAGFESAIYASQAEADYQRLVVAGNLEELQRLGGDQLTEAEKQLKSLDGILDTARAQIDALRGIDSSVMSVEAAIAALAVAMARESAVMGGGVGGVAGKPAVTLPGYLQGGNGAAYDIQSDTGYQAGTGLPWMGQTIRDAASELVQAGNARAVYDAIAASGFSLSQADSILQIPAGTAEEWARSVGLPVFHQGTNYVPQTGLALLEKGEAVIPRAYNPAALGVSGNTERLEQLVEVMAAELAQMRAQLDVANRHAARTADATNGRPEAPVLVEVVA